MRVAERSQIGVIVHAAAIVPSSLDSWEGPEAGDGSIGVGEELVGRFVARAEMRLRH